MHADPLLIMRRNIAVFSLQKAQARIRKEKALIDSYDEIELEESFDQKVLLKLGYSELCSEYGDSSAVTRGRFTSDGKYFVTVGSSGNGKVWATEDSESPNFCQEVTKLKGQIKLCDVDVHPRLGQIPAFAPNIITGCTSGDVMLWTFDPSLSEQKCFTLKAHSDRVNSTRFHPNGAIFMTASYDKSWGIWDIGKVKQLSNQKGHQREIQTLNLHPDGSLICTGDLGGFGMIWDLRTGKGIYEIECSNSILCSSFHPNGFELAVGGKNNMINIFDIRRRRQIKSIPAHLKIVSDLHYNEEGSILFSSSHDNTIKLWHGLAYTEIDQLLEHPSKVTSLAVSGDLLASTLIDRKWVIWSNKKLTTKNVSKKEQAQIDASLKQ